MSYDQKFPDTETLLSALSAADDNFDTLTSQISEIDGDVKFLLHTRDIANQMIVT